MNKTDIQNEIEYYNNQSFTFIDFMEVPELTDGVISIVCAKKTPAEPERKWVPSYWFDIMVNGERVGEVNLRIGYTEGLYYGGQIAYNVDEAHRGKGYAVRACRLLWPVAAFHGMTKLLITNDVNNTASRRVCEKLGARLLRVVDVPEWHDLYKEGQFTQNIFEWAAG